MKKEKINENKVVAWKLITILFLLLTVVIFVKSEYEKKELYKEYSDCILKKNLCNTYFNESMKGLKECIFSFGHTLNFTDKEIEDELNNPNPFYLNITREVLK